MKNNVVYLIQDVNKKRKGDIDQNMRRIEAECEYAIPGTPEWKALREAYEQEIKMKKMMREQRCFGIPAKDLMWGALGVAGLVLVMSWDMESPRAVKLGTFVASMLKPKAL